MANEPTQRSPGCLRKLPGPLAFVFRTAAADLYQLVCIQGLIDGTNHGFRGSRLPHENDRSEMMCASAQQLSLLATELRWLATDRGRPLCLVAGILVREFFGYFVRHRLTNRLACSGARGHIGKLGSQRTEALYKHCDLMALLEEALRRVREHRFAKSAELG